MNTVRQAGFPTRERQLVKSAHLEPSVLKELVRAMIALQVNILSVRQIRAHLVRAGNLVRTKRELVEAVMLANSAVETPLIARTVMLAATLMSKRALV